MELPKANTNGAKELPNWNARASLNAPTMRCGHNLRGVACDFKVDATVVGTAVRVRFLEAKEGSFLQCHFGTHVYFGLQQHQLLGPSHLILTSFIDAKRFRAGRLAKSPPRWGQDSSYCRGPQQLDLSESLVGNWIDLACIIDRRFVALYIRCQGEDWNVFAGFESHAVNEPYATTDGVSFLIENFLGVFPERRAAIEVCRVGLLTSGGEWRDPKCAQIVLPSDPRFDPNQDRLLGPDRDLREDPRRHVWYGYTERSIALLQGPWEADYGLQLPVRGDTRIDVPNEVVRSISWDGEFLPSSVDA